MVRSVPFPMLPILATDGLFLSLIAATYLALLLARVLRRSPPQTGLILLGVVILSAAMRLLISREAILTAWTYTRVVPLARAISNGVLFDFLEGYVGRPIFLTELIFNTNFVMASLTPLPLFLHANFLLKDTRIALAAAAMLAVLPMHITFARSDVYFMQSLFFSSLAFATLYSELSDPSKAWRIISLLFLGPLLYTVFLARPLNLIFHPLLLATIFVTVGREIPRERRWIAAVVVTIPAILDVLLNLLVGYSSQVQEGLGLRTLWQAAAMLINPYLNTIVNPRVTPLLIPILMVLGVTTLWRSGKKPIALYLLGWLVAFFVTHAYIMPFRTTMMARYHLHLVTPALLMAAAATPRLLQLGRLPKVALAGYLLACPLLHLGFERDVDFSIQKEFEFLTNLREVVPPDCTIIEYIGPNNCVRGPRVQRVAAYAGKSRPPRWPTLQLIGPPRAHGLDQTPPHGAVDIDALDSAVGEAQCVLFYEGNLCRSFGKSWSELAPTCNDIHERYTLEVVAEAQYTEYVYDPADARGGCSAPPPGGRYPAPPTDEARLRLYRIAGAASGPIKGNP